MPMMTVAADLFDDKPQEWHEMPPHLHDLTEAAAHARDAWMRLDDFQSSRYPNLIHGGDQDYHDARSAEQQTYLAWQAIEFAFQQIHVRWQRPRSITFTKE